MNGKMAVIAALAFVLLCAPARALDESPEATFASLKQAANESDWNVLLSHMTQQIQERLVHGAVNSAADTATRTFPPGPEGDAHRKRLQQIFAEHAGDSVSLDDYPPMARGERDKEKLRQIEKQQKQFAVDALGAVKDRNAFLAEITKAMIEAPIPGGVTFTFRLGEISQVETSGPSATALIVVDASEFNSFAPPSAVKFTLVDGKWKYDGVDSVKQQEIDEQFMDLFHGDSIERDDGKNALSQKPVESTPGTIQLTASWESYAEESTYDFAKKWPELTQMKPAIVSKRYDNAFFTSMLPPDDIEIGGSWKLDPNNLLPLLKQFHAGATCKLHHQGPTGAHACLIGKNDHLLKVVLRLHGEIELDRGGYYTPSQFEGHLVWDHAARSVLSFRLFVPPRKTNVDINWLESAPDPDGSGQPKEWLGVDIGFIPKMELSGGAEDRSIRWKQSISIDDARKLLAQKFYRFAKIHWMPWEAAVAESQRTGKPLHVVALFGTLDDESC